MGGGSHHGLRAALDGPVEAIDAQLVGLVRGAASIRLRLGEVSAEILRCRAHEDLGFSSIDSYVAERCGLDPRWVADARTLARHLEPLPRLKAALASGQVGWSMAEVVARKATPTKEAFLVALAKRSKVGQMRKLLAEMSGGSAEADAGGADDEAPHRRKRVCRLVDRDAAALFLETRELVECHAGTNDAEVATEAMLAEALERLAGFVDEAAAPRVPRRRAPRDEPDPPFREPPPIAIDFGPMPEDARGLDAEAVRLARELAGRELRIGSLALELHDCGGHRALGYASEGQYCRERLGISESSLQNKKWLAKHASRFPELCQALDEACIGVEAARLVARVATQDSVVAWIDHAERRTFKHLREDVAEAETASNLSGEVAVGPPTQISGGVRTVPQAADDPTAVPPRKMGRVELGLPLSPEVLELFLLVEDAWKRAGQPYGDFFRFLTVEWLATWEHDLDPDAAYADVYWRDGWQCASPTCTRRDVTPH